MNMSETDNERPFSDESSTDSGLQNIEPLISDELKPLDTGLKQDLIKSNYQMTYNSYDKSRERINTLRQWELTVLVALIGLMLNQSLGADGIVLLIAAVLLFAGLELVFRGHMTLALITMNEMESLFSEEDDTEKIMEQFEFGGVAWRNFTFSDKVQALLNGFTSADFLFWQSFLGVLILVLALN
ncbi:MAG: hypothetical protein KC449_25770 [Anaerolineales bacterium]|nr:hypothetical protein [Anaerolineales bacterium]